MKIVWVIKGDSRGDIDRRPGLGGPRRWWQHLRAEESAARRYLTQQPRDAEVYATKFEAEVAAECIGSAWAAAGIRVVSVVKPRRLP